jgi:hypothetical protein
MPIPPFRPAWWLPGAHAQTLGARLFRSSRGVTHGRERLELPDGDFVDLDWVTVVGGRPAPADGPLVLVLHGLEGSARSTYALEAYRALAAHGVSAVGLNFRSCSGEPNRLPRLYHSGDTGDLAHVVATLRDRRPDHAIGAVGFSLGGNVLLKFLGERSEASPLAAAAVISVPFDLSAGAAHLERGFARVYRHFLVRKLQRKVAVKRDVLREHVDVATVLAARSFHQFDDAITAPLHGFDGAADYYRRSSSAGYVDRIRVPTRVIHARDDPFLPAAAIPERALAANPCLEVTLTDSGGHVGFVTGSVWAPVFWAEREAARFVAGKLLEGGPVDERASPHTPRRLASHSARCPGV